MGKSRLGIGNKYFGYPRASLYKVIARGLSRQVREGEGQRYGFPYGERHLQCVWFDGRYRPELLHTREGEEVIVESPGRWNLEAGPDFLDAVLLVGGERRRVVGDVEIHIHPAHWRHHAHRYDSRYSRVVAHVSYFKGASQKAHLPPGAVEICLEDELNADDLFSFESVDTSAYPYAERRSPSPCGAALAARTVDCAILLLESAGEERLRLKTERMRRLIEQHGEERVLYEEVMCSLGYKNNRVPFRELAARVPVDALRRESAGDTEKAFALLLGVGGLLPVKPSRSWDYETRDYLRGLWSFWWKRQCSWESRMMPGSSWSLAGVRPQNHPIRRIAAAAGLFCGPKTFRDSMFEAGALPPERWVSATTAILSRGASDPYWKRRMGFSGSPAARNVSLIGEERAAAILCNVMVPFTAAAGWPSPAGRMLQDLVPAAHDDGVIRRTASALFGRDHNPRLYRTGLRQQGLQQINHDFCDSDRTACRECALPAAIAAIPV